MKIILKLKTIVLPGKQGCKDMHSNCATFYFPCLILLALLLFTAPRFLPHGDGTLPG